MPRTRVKICGITRNQDALLAASLGADAIGLNFHPDSPRAIQPEQIKEILSGLSGLVSVVALFVDPDVARVEAVMASGGIHCLQFHGDESPQFCQRFGLPVLKAIRVTSAADTLAQLTRYATVANILLDSYDARLMGGTGKVFDWNIARAVVAASRGNIILAGGLNPDNVGAAVGEVQPFGVDVSSGVESQPGIKDPHRLRQFFAAVNQADRGL